MAKRWKREKVLDNDGRSMTQWQRGDYRIEQCIAVWERGSLIGWEYELYIIGSDGRERHLDALQSLAAAKRAAANHAKKEATQ